jgi:hypothetical protein
MMDERPRDKSDRRFYRLLDRIERRWPQVRGTLAWLRRPQVRLIRLPIAFLLILGGIFSFLPVLGIWMLPLGLLLAGIDVPLLRGPVARGVNWFQWKWRQWRRRWTARRAARKK